MGNGLLRYLLALTAVLMMSTPLPAHARVDSVPDWVRTAAAQKLPEYPRDTNAVVLLDETTFTVGTDGRAVEHVRHVVKILRPQGRDEAIIHINYDNDTKILSMGVWSIGPDGHEYAMKEKEFTDRALGEYDGVFSDDRFRVANAPGSDPGGVIAYEYEQRGRPMVNEETWVFQDELPHLAQSFTLELPPDYSYTTTWAHHAQAAPMDLEHERWRWEMDNTPAIDLSRVPLSPNMSALAGRMTVRYSPPGGKAPGTWQSIGEWYQPLIQDRLQPTPDITAKAQQLAAGKADFFEKAEAIGEFVQKQVRYFGIELGIGGYQPHAAGDIFHNMYGDCKDKATLTSAMLSAVGIHAALMMVDTHRGAVDSSAPSLWGNHMILAIEIPQGYESSRLHSVDMMEHMLPSGMNVEVGNIGNLEEYEQPLTVVFNVKGPIGSSTGKRLVLPADVFVANEKPVFPHEKRESPIAFNYAEIMQDATRYTFPASLALESSPSAQQIPFLQNAVYKMGTQAATNSITTQRNFEIGTIFYAVNEYPQLREFYNKFETKDQEPVVLKFTASATAGQ